MFAQWRPLHSERGISHINLWMFLCFCRPVVFLVRFTCRRQTLALLCRYLPHVGLLVLMVDDKYLILLLWNFNKAQQIRRQPGITAHLWFTHFSGVYFFCSSACRSCRLWNTTFVGFFFFFFGDCCRRWQVVLGKRLLPSLWGTFWRDCWVTTVLFNQCSCPWEGGGAISKI